MQFSGRYTLQTFSTCFSATDIARIAFFFKWSKNYWLLPQPVAELCMWVDPIFFYSRLKHKKWLYNCTYKNRLFQNNWKLEKNLSTKCGNSATSYAPRCNKAHQISGFQLAGQLLNRYEWPWSISTVVKIMIYQSNSFDNDSTIDPFSWETGAKKMFTFCIV